jgi:hypothetical protein
MDGPPLYAQYKVILEMLADRGYVAPPLKTPDEYELAFCARTDKNLLYVDRNKLTMQATHMDRTHTIRVLFHDNGLNKTGKKELESLVRRAGDNLKLIIVAPAFCKPTPQAAAILHQLSRTSSKTTVQWICEEELAINIVRATGRFTKRHRIDRESEVLTRRYVPPPATVRTSVTRHMPALDVDKDPVACYYGIGHGKSISRNGPSETAGRYTMHRVGAYSEEMPAAKSKVKTVV